MLISCRFSVVGLHLLLLTHVARSFVLLTANVDDVKKIARKFVSDSLAEKIVDFIARATEAMGPNTKDSQENENNADQENSQVSAENKMYNADSHDFDNQPQAAETKSKDEIVLGKVTEKIPQKTSVKKRHKFEEPSTHKTRKEPISLHGRSRYIIQTENKASPTTEKALNKEDEYNKMKEKIQLLEDNFYNTPDGKKKTNKRKKKNKGRAYKLLSGFDAVENDAAKDGTPESKRANDVINARAMNEEKARALPTEEAATTAAIDVEQRVNKKQIEKAVTVFDQHEVKNEKKDEFAHDENKIIGKTEKVPTSRSGSHVTERHGKEEAWWERELPNHPLMVNSAGKSWF